MITVQSCWTKPFYNGLLNSAQVQILRSLGSPACGWLRIPKLAGYNCLAQFFTSLMHMNCSQAPSSMLMSILVCSEASHCLLIKLILVEDVGSLAPKGQRGGDDHEYVAPLSQKVMFLHTLLTTSALLDQVIKNQTSPAIFFVLQSEISHASELTKKCFSYMPLGDKEVLCSMFNGATVH